MKVTYMANTIDEIKKRILKKSVPIKKRITDVTLGLKEIEKYKQQNKGESFLEGIYKYLRNNNMKASDLYNMAFIDRRVFSKMSSKDYKISKNTAICFCLAMELSLNDTNDMLKRIGYALSNYDDFDIVILYCFENKIYDIIEINGYLDDLNLPLLGQKTR